MLDICLQVTLRFVSALKAFRAIRMVRTADLKHACVEHGSLLARTEQRREIQRIEQTVSRMVTAA